MVRDRDEPATFHRRQKNLLRTLPLGDAKNTESKTLQCGGEGTNSNLSIYVALDFIALSCADIKEIIF